MAAAVAASFSPISAHSSPLSFLLFLLLLLPAFAAAQTIAIGSSLSAVTNSTSWLSPSGDFAFGFRPINGTSDSFLLCIWYAKIPDRTIVWYANGDSPAPAGSTVQLSATVGLRLANPQDSEIWRSGQLSGRVRSASMNDSGNFVIRAGNAAVLWQSFDDLTDTILPPQTLNGDRVILSSRRSDTNFSKGKFRLVLQPDGNLDLATVNPPTERTNPPYREISTNAGNQLVFDESGVLYVTGDSRNGSDRFQFNLTDPLPPSTGEFYHRLVLSSDGFLAQYYHPKSGNGNGGRSWTVLWQTPSNMCRATSAIGGVACGFNNVCHLEPNNRTRCECPTGFSLMDPNDPNGDCKSNYTQSCDEEDDDSVGIPMEELYGFEAIPNTDWPFSDYAVLEPFSEAACRNSCLYDCKCGAAVFRSGDKCWKKKLPLSNGRLDANEEGIALLKVRLGKANPRNGDQFAMSMKKKIKEKENTLIVVGSVVLGFLAFVNVIVVVVVCSGDRRKKISSTSSGEISPLIEQNLRCFTYEELEEATNGFEEELGRGAFGIVYKGEIRNGCVVAVKKLNSSGNGSSQEFRTEVNVIGQTHHKNLVRLIGYCEDGERRLLLVYEYLSNGTLAQYLFGGESRPNWGERIRIALGIARGLSYLHEECITQIIHCDIKPQNILLDDNRNARISDFGLAKLLLLNQSQTHTAIRGTRGYVAPEWFRSSPITVKVDVYSFGVLLLEIISCRRSVDNNESVTERVILADWAYDCYIEGVISNIVKDDVEALGDIQNLKKFVMIAIWCIQEDPSIRPTMRQVWQMLEGLTEVPVPPCPSNSIVMLTEC